MKLLAPCFVILALAACGSSTATTTSGTGTTGGTGGKTGTSTGGKTTGSAAGTTTGNPLGQTCTLDSQGNDSCTGFGLECSADLTGQAGNGDCILPQDLSLCDQSSFGCQDGGSTIWVDAGVPSDAGVVVDAGIDVDAGDNSDAGVDTVWVDAGPIQVAATGYVDAGVPLGDLVCSTGFNDGAGDPVDVCLVPCTSGAQCGGIDVGCLGAPAFPTIIPTGCFPNQCNPANIFATCDGTTPGANDGQCLPFVSPTAGTVDFGICYQDGTVPLGQPCNPVDRNGQFGECALSAFCMPAAATGGDGGLCYAITADGGSCAATEDPLGLGITFFGDDSAWGICAQDCSTGQVCTIGTCQALASGGSACLP